AGHPGPDEGHDPLAHPPPRARTIVALDRLLAKGPHALVVVVGPRVALALGRGARWRDPEGADQAVVADGEGAVRMVVGGLPHGHHAVDVRPVVEDGQGPVDEVA